jgi:hypothetical protein
MRPVIGAMASTDMTGKELVIHWNQNPHRPNGKKEPFPPMLTDIWTGPFTDTDKMASGWIKAADVSQPGDVWCCSSNLAPWLPYIVKPWLHYFRRLMLVPELYEKYASMQSLCSGPVIGVMIRKWRGQAENQNVEWFIRRMHHFLEVSQNLTFYLAADAPEVDERIYREFGPDKILSLKHGTNYAWDFNGIRNAAVDIHLLAATGWVIGSTRSSYCQFVSQLRSGSVVAPLHCRPNTIGGRCEDSWNPPVFGELVMVFGVNGANTLYDRYLEMESC